MARPRTLFGCLVCLVLSACAPAEERFTVQPPPRDPAPSSAAPSAIPQASPLPVQTAPPPAPPERAVIVALEGMGAVDMEAGMDSGRLPGLTSLRERGMWWVLGNVSPGSAVVSYASLATGSFPAHTGIIADRVHRPEDGLYWYTSAYALPLEDMPIWEAARRSGRSAAVLFWPGIAASPDGPVADCQVDYGERLAYSRQHTLTLYPAGRWLNAPETASPPLEGRFVIEQDDTVLAEVFVLAVDSPEASGPGPDTIILSRGDRTVDDADGRLSVRPAEWLAWPIDREAGWGADFLITGADLPELTLYQSGLYRLVAVPEDLQARLVDELGYFAPPPDYYALEHGWLNAEQFMAMAQRQSDWMLAATLAVDRFCRPDLLLTLQQPVDQAGHQFLMIDTRQAGYTQERAAEYASYRAQAAAQADRALGQLVDSRAAELSDGTTAFIVIGMGGLTPVHTRVNLNRALADAGLLRLGRRGFVVVQQSQAIAFASGGTAHIYINLAGREQGGVVPQAGYAAVQQQVIDVLAGLVDPADGQPVLSAVRRQAELVEQGLAGRYTGDVIVQAAAGYLLSDDREAAAVFETPAYYGAQGYGEDIPAADAGLVLVGPGLTPGTRGGRAAILDISPTLAHWLGFEPLPADGHLLAGWPLP